MSLIFLISQKGKVCDLVKWIVGKACLMVPQIPFFLIFPSMSIHTTFQARFGDAPALTVRAPGRINLIGEHTDYTDGYVMPAAIDRVLLLALGVAPDGTCTIFAEDLDEEVSFDRAGATLPQQPWARYILGVMDGMGLLQAPGPGFNLVFGGDIPLGAGLSSSAALCAGLALGLNELYGQKRTRLALARLAQAAEHRYAGVQCGIMDQIAVLMGKRDHFLLLDCRRLSHQEIPVSLGDHSLLLCDSGVKHALADSAYNQRRAECEEGLHALRARYPELLLLRDAKDYMFTALDGKIDPAVMRRIRYVTLENRRVQEMVTALEGGDLGAVGSLLYRGHEGLQHGYEVSCPELDYMVQVAQNFHGVAGARMMGGGFGGCMLTLLRTDELPQFQNLLSVRYQNEFGMSPRFYPVSISDGAEIQP
jgi:galactokinase